MAHSDVLLPGCNCSQVSKVGLVALLSDRHLKGHKLQSLTISLPYQWVWKPTWMYSDEMFYLYCTSCNAVFLLLKCSKFSLCWRSLYLSLLCDKDISRGRRGETKDSDRHVMFHVHGEWRWDGTRTLHTSTTCWTLKTNTILSLFLPPSFPFSVWLSDHVKQWELNLDSCSGIASDDTV